MSIWSQLVSFLPSCGRSSDSNFRESTSGADFQPGRQPDQPSSQEERDELHEGADRRRAVAAGVAQDPACH